MDIITRQQYAGRIDSWLGRGLIIVLVGQRRVGKSSMMKDFVARHGSEPNANIVYIDKEKRCFKELANADQLDAYVQERLAAGKRTYLLIDEVQDIDGWERSVRSFATDDATDVIITGSNSRMLSGELATLLAGRYVQIHIQSLSYEEFLAFHGFADSDDALRLYLYYGGMPGLINVGLDNEERVWDYLSGIYNTVVLKDIVERHQIRNLPLLHRLIGYLADTTGKPNSAVNIARALRQGGFDTSANSIIAYSGWLDDAFLTATARRYDIHGRRLLDTLGKTYFGDVGLRNYIAGGSREGDLEKVVESVVYQHLRRLGYDVCVGQLRAGEVDFVCSRPGERAYVQASLNVAADATRAREFGALRAIPDHYPKYVVSATPLLRRADADGITHLSLRHFLINGLD